MTLPSVKDMEGLLRDATNGATCLGLEVEGTTEAGENYGSTVIFFRANLRDDTRPEGQQNYSLPLMAKRLPVNAYLREVFNVSISFRKEIEMYKCVVPQYEALQSEMNIPEKERLHIFPKLYGARLGSKGNVVDDEAILILENLRSAGYKLGSRMEGLDLDHCKLVVRELAKFHATGIVLKRKKPEVFWGQVSKAAEFFYADIPEEKKKAENDQFVKFALNEIAENVPTCGPYLKRLEHVELKDPIAVEPFSTVTHSDFWVNNMMFAYKDGKPVSIKMVDFQITAISSPVGDLLFLLYNSATSPVLRLNFDELVKHYHDTFYAYLELHNAASDDVNWEAFLKEIERSAPNEIAHIISMISVIRAEKTVNNAEITPDTFGDMGCGELKTKRYAEVVQDLAERGWI